MGPRRCRRGRPAVERIALGGPHASMGPRRCRRGRRWDDPACPDWCVLQWGRVVADAEGRVGGPCTAAMSASMGPRRCRRGRPPKVIDPRAQRVIASMGPRRCRRGREDPRAQLLARYARLQWGRVVADAEGPDRVLSRLLAGASMGPRRCRRGRCAGNGRPPRAGACFNGAASLPTRKVQRAPAATLRK